MIRDVNTNRHLREKPKQMSANTSRFSSVLLLDDDLFLSHVAPSEHPERGERLLAVREGLARGAPPADGGRISAGSSSPLHAGSAFGSSSAYIRLPFGDASDEQLARVHDPAYIEQIGQLTGQTGFLESDTFVSPGSVAASRRAAGAAVALVDGLLDGKAHRGLALPRPPGHHALSDRAMGFCLFNNVAVAAAHARARGCERVLVLDWDVHHGNGTEAIFYADGQVLFVSLHQYPCYPGTGAESDVGEGDGRGKTVNLPFAPGGTDSLYTGAFSRIVLPIVEQFAPDFALVSCGFDAHERDPLAQMRLSAQAFGNMTMSLVAALPSACPLGLVLEGGYDLQALTDSSEAVARALFEPAPRPPSGETWLDNHGEQQLTRIARTQGAHWRL